MRRGVPWLALAFFLGSFLPALLNQPGLAWAGESGGSVQHAHGWWRQPRNGSVFFWSECADVRELKVAGQAARRGNRGDFQGFLGCVDLEAGLHPIQVRIDAGTAEPDLQLSFSDELPRSPQPTHRRLSRSRPLAAGWAWALRLIALALASLRWRWARRLLAGAVGLGLAWGAAELALLATGSGPSARIPGSIWVDYDFGPGKTVTYRGVHATQVQEFVTKVTWNQHGYRDEEWIEEPSRSRVLVLGDSFVAAHEVPLEQTFHARLEQHFPELEFLAMGRGGTGPVQQLELLQACDLQGLSAVLWAIFPGNDIMDSSPALANQRRAWVEQVYYGQRLPARVRLLNACAGPGRWMPWLLDRNLSWLESLASDSGDGEGARATSPAAQVFQPAGTDTLWDTAWAAVESALRRGQAWCHARQLPLVVLILPTATWPLPGGSAVDPALRLGPTEHLASVCEQLQIKVLPLEACFANRAGAFFAHDGHWSPRGHELITAELASRLRGWGWPQSLNR